MSVRRFVGATSREVMRQVRDALGDDALIVANRRMDDGVEILAMADGAVDGLASSAADAPATPPPARTPAGSYAQVQQQAQQAQPAPSQPTFSQPTSSQQTPSQPPSTPPSSASSSSASPADPVATMSEKLLREMQDMRELLAGSTSVPDKTTPQGWRVRLHQMLFDLGFSVEIANELLEGLPAELAALPEDNDQPLAWLREQLVQKLAVLDDEDAFFDQTGIVALVGPTGVGKTTTTAKLAARFVMRHGTRPVALVTTDSFRIGAHEQLRIYARLLDIPMYALDAEQPIDDLLHRLQGKQWVIVDTVGMSQRDQRVIEQIAHLQDGHSRVRMALLLNAASQPETLEEVVLRYRQAARAAGAGLDDGIITKQDEAGRLGPVLDIVMRHGMRVLFGSHGQRVPEDMAVADASELMSQALDSAAPRAAGSTQAPPPAPVRLPRWSQDVLGQGRRLSSLLGRLRSRVGGFDALEQCWDLAAMPGAVQLTRLEQLLEMYPADGEALGVRWSARRNERGCDWAMPDVGLDPDGATLALPWLQHRQPAGWQQRVKTLTERDGIAVHLLPTLPDAATCDWLEAGRLTWVSQSRGAQRVYADGERTSLRQLFLDSTLTHQSGVRFRARDMQLWNVYAEVSDDEGRPMLAWYGEVCDPESAKTVVRRYWLTPRRLGAEVLSLLITQLQGEGLAALTRRAFEQIRNDDDGDVSAEVRLLMASGAAAVVGHLDMADDEAAATLRRDLLALLGARRRRRDTAMLDALLYALMARDAIRQLGSVNQEGVV
ncbi:flagellar biosynthesis protein FlhF [Vreelandella jeotgali]|uniref:flagellar biosynthesis protein FlhF n=1 Tax=Vreelandella jeotgali TaxID=553386 RepID=UPI00036B7C75|nr:flagellar biosynthesis protein FlhF [Halomonas jeotgali]